MLNKLATLSLSITCVYVTYYVMKELHHKDLQAKAEESRQKERDSWVAGYEDAMEFHIEEAHSVARCYMTPEKYVKFCTWYPPLEV